MAIGYDTCSYEIASSTVFTKAYTATAEPNRAMLVGVGGATSVEISSIAYGGAPGVLIQDGGLVSPRLSSFWIIINPPSGLNNLVIERTASFRFAVVTSTWYGVDQINPIRDSGVDPDAAAVTQFSVPLTNEISDVLVGFGYRAHTSDSWTDVVDETKICSGVYAHAEDAYAINVCQYYKLSTVTPDTVVAESGVARPGSLMACALRPYIPALGRAVKYYFNIWDPSARVRDRNDRVVPPNEIEPETWLEVQGHVLPDPRVYDTFILDPTKARIVEVTATEQGATLRANRSQFADVLISRASAGRA